MRALFSLLIVAAGATSAAAQTNVAQAELLFKEAQALMEERDFAAACEKFALSHELDPVPSTLLNLAHCREEHGQYATAWGLFLRVKLDTDGVPKHRTFNKAAKTRADRLEPRVSYLSIQVPDESRVDGLVITRNGVELVPALWNQTLPIDGGNYEIAAKAPGHEAWSTTITIELEEDREVITVPRFKAEVPAPVTAPAAPPPEQPASTARRPRWLPLALGSGGAVLLGVGIAFEVSARGTYDDAVAATPQARRDELLDQAVGERVVGVIAGVVGLACVGTAVYAWFAGDDRASDVEVAPLLAPGTVGVALTGALP